MTKFMLIAGILFVAMGVALGLMVLISPGQMQVVAVTPEVAALFLVGGVLAIGIGGLIGALEPIAASQHAPTAAEAVVPVAPAAETAIPEFGRRFRVAPTPPIAEEEISPSVRETITALENAKADIGRAFRDEPKVEEPAPPPEPIAVAQPKAEPETTEEPVEKIEVPVEVEEAETAAIAAEGEDQLYVVEERLIRARPARLLSDGTVEAETDEGWMRFENLEHLDEYLDAMAPAAKV